MDITRIRAIAASLETKVPRRVADVVRRVAGSAHELAVSVAAATAPVGAPITFPISMDFVAADNQQTVADLRQLYKLYEQLFNNAPVGFHNIAPDGTITEVNNRWLEILGYSRDEVVGRSIFDFVASGQRVNAEARFRERLMYGEPETPRVDDRLFVKKDGTIIPVSTKDTVIKDSNGQALFVQTAFLDLSAVREMEKTRTEKQVLESMLRTMAGYTDWVSQVVTSIYGKIEMTNALLRRINASISIAEYTRLEKSLAQSFDACLRLMRGLNMVREFMQDSEKPTIKPVDVWKVIRQICNSVQSGLVSHISLVGATDEQIIGTGEAQLQRALEELIIYELANLETNGEVKISVERTELEVIIYIAADGSRQDPITMDVIEKPFYHMVSPLLEIGLRLSLAHKILLSIGAKLEVAQNASWQTFVVRLPVEPAQVVLQKN